MAGQLTLKNVVLANSSALPTATDVVTTTGLVFVNSKIKSGDYADMGNGMMGAKKTFIDGQWVTAEFDIPVQMKKASGLGVAPSLSQMFKICGLAETITASTKVEYKPGGAVNGSGQVKVFTDGYSKALTGVASNLKISGKIGEPLSATFSVKGFVGASAAVLEANPTVTLDTGVAPIVSKITVLTVGGTSIQADSFDFDLGNMIQDVYAIGMSQYYFQDFDPTLTIDAIKVKGTDEQTWTDFANGAVKAVLIQVGVAGSMIELSIPYAILKDVSESDSNGMVKLSRTFRAQASVGNDNFTITYK